MRKILLVLSCMLGFTSCEIEHHDHKAPTTPEQTQPVTPENPNGTNVTR